VDLGKIRATGVWLHKNKVPQFAKIYFTSFQILGSFSMYAIEWPPEFTDAINWLKGTMSVDLMKLPSVSCLWNGVDFQTYLRTYTLAPLVLIAMLACSSSLPGTGACI